MKKCELCSRLARMYCQSDKASLCYECDQNVHSANFLVAKHSRTLLCHKCQSPTPWLASGLNLGRAVSLCVNCLEENSSQRRLVVEGETSHRGNDVVKENCVVHDDLREEGDGETDDDDEEYSDESENEDEDGENQVVPWSSVAPPPVTASSSSTSDEFSSSRFSSIGFRSAIKRERLDGDIDSEDDTVCSSERSDSRARTEVDDTISLRSFRPLDQTE